MNINVKLDKGAFMPHKAYDLDAGFDLMTPHDAVIRPYNNYSNDNKIVIDTGVHIDIPEGYCGLIVSKSGLNVNHSITSTGLIDSGYSGSIRVKLYNNEDKFHSFKRGDKIAQIVILPIPAVTLIEVDDFDGGERGDNGFGSTGK